MVVVMVMMIVVMMMFLFASVVMALGALDDDLAFVVLVVFLIMPPLLLQPLLLELELADLLLDPLVVLSARGLVMFGQHQGEGPSIHFIGLADFLLLDVIGLGAAVAAVMGVVTSLGFTGFALDDDCLPVFGRGGAIFLDLDG